MARAYPNEKVGNAAKKKGRPEGQLFFFILVFLTAFLGVSEPFLKSIFFFFFSPRRERPFIFAAEPAQCYERRGNVLCRGISVPFARGHPRE